MDRCELCGQDEEWHREHKPRHTFSGRDAGAAGKLNEKEKAKPAQRVLSGDPALRVALVEAGVLEYPDIVRAEEKLREGKPVIVGDDHTVTRPGVPVPENGNRENSESRH